jgi:hypothetical protein
VRADYALSAKPDIAESTLSKLVGNAQRPASCLFFAQRQLTRRTTLQRRALHANRRLFF